MQIIKWGVRAAVVLGGLWCNTDGAQRGPPTFYVQGLAHKCLTFGVPAAANGAVVLSACNHSADQQINVEEVVPEVVVRPPIDIKPHISGGFPQQRREVVLKAGPMCIGAEFNLLVNNTPLVLQPCTGSTAQVFSLDGDSIILAANRDLVAQVKNAIPADGTPLVLNQRNLADPEFWVFSATDGSGRPPTLGFETVTNAADFCDKLKRAGFGTVIQIVPDNLLDVTNTCTTPLQIPAGVTIRGNRNGVLEGPQVSLTAVPKGQSSATLFQVAGDNVRITGLRILGTSRSHDTQPQSTGILITNQAGTIVDHDDISDWTEAAVSANGLGQHDNKACTSSVPPGRQFNVRAVRNFIHHNEMTGAGYGVVTGSDGYSSIEGNTFLENRHAITADGTQLVAYNAVSNLVLSTVPQYGSLGNNAEQDFDMHGTDDGTHHLGGVAGNSVLISGNTFLGTNRANFLLRGRACAADRFVNNMSMQGRSAAVQWFCLNGSSPETCSSGTPPSNLTINSKFGVGDPTQRLAVGDFDGDGKDDLFLTTGTAWYYAPAGNAEWRLLNAQPQTVDALLFGDLDGDGRTDVLTKNGRDWLVSWGGISPWQKINASDGPISDYVVGDFVGDGHADIFHADGTHWLVSDGGTKPFTVYATSSYRIPDLRFGDFDGHGKSDVMGIVDNQWMAVFATQDHHWKKLNSKLSDTVNGLIVADFDGNKRADIATFTPIVENNIIVRFDWKVSRDGVGPWTKLTTTAPSLAAIGRFDAAPGADLLLWNENALFIASSGTAAPVRQSRQDMR